LRRQERWALVALALALAAVAALPLLRSVDHAVLTWLEEHGSHGTRVVAHRLDLGARGALLAIAAAVVWHTGGRGLARALAVLAGGAFVGELLKTAIERPRPSAAAGIVAGNSLPSGHIMNTTIAALLLLLLALRTEWPRRGKWIVAAVAAAAVAMQTVGRVLHGSHWPSDVAPSVLLGVAWVLGTGRLGELRRPTRVAVVAAALAAYAFFWALPAARFHLAAQPRLELRSHAGAGVETRL
jgi:membrane-associated phospholipid phosphatase